MKTITFSKTGEKREIKCDITLFCDRIRAMPDKFEIIVLKEIENKSCAIYKDDQIYKLIDFCSFNTKLYTKQDKRPKLLKPLTFYELRDSDIIFVGEHEIVFHSEPDETEKQSFYIPETQEVEQDIQIQNTVFIDDDIEIPETQELTPEIEFEKPMKTQFIEPETARSLKIATEKVRNEYFVETQPVTNVFPPYTRRYAAKQNEIKPKTVPLSVFGCETQALNAETQAMSFTQLMKDNDPKKATSKRKSEPPKEIKKETIKNSVLLSDTESDSDDDRSKISAASVKYADQSHPNYNNSLSQYSINDDFYMGDIQSTEFDSQFMEQVNSSCNMENSNQIINSEIPVVKEEVMKISNSNLTKEDNEDDIKPGPRKRIKLFKFVSSDEE
ncbi:unnamed protein product [Chironomus riparius]|uniref:Uncharacterized protein n=1 Tax=Chironomus riparius TaxID=315576 RepID=A0A9P0ND05_9DIPT|nr:unnamed protein product [Chironomus riparius]